MQKQKILSHKDLLVWQRAMDLVDTIYRVSSQFPREEQYGLVSQMRRAAVSVPSNIAEGKVRRSTKDFIQFLQISAGSLAELETQLEVAQRQKFIKNIDYTVAMELVTEVGRMLNGLISSLNTKH